MDFGKSWKERVKENVTEKKKEIGIAVALIVVFALLSFFGSRFLGTNVVVTEFENKEVKAGEQTVLNVRVTNTYKEDFEELKVSIKPESKALNFSEKQKKEENVGAGSYREFYFPLKVSSEATPGRYKVSAKAVLGENEVNSVDYLSVEK